MARYLIGIDVGGTFTDFVAYDHDMRTVQVWKNLSTPEDPTNGILAGLGRLDALGAIDHLRLGTTVATNTILERKGAVVAYLTTRGFHNVPFIQRGNRKSHYDITWIKPAPLVQHRHCFELDKRIDRDGHTLIALDEAQVRELARRIKACADHRSARGEFLVFLPGACSRTPCQGDFCPGAACPAGIDLLRRAAALERVRARLDDHRRRLSETADRRLPRQDADPFHRSGPGKTLLDIRTIGAGGGSIAWIDKGGLLRVGPKSTGAVPGPASY